MSIELKLNNNHSYNFNETRLSRVVNAKTLTEAQYMGPWDNIKDFFQGGKKRQAIETLFNQINQPLQHDTLPNRQLMKFEELRHLAKPERQKDFTVHVNPPNKYGKWDYRLQIAEHNIYQANEIVDNPMTSYGCFCTVKAGMAFRQYLSDNPNIFNLDSYINSKIQCMSDSQTTQKQLQASLDDTRYSRENFCAIETASDPAKFIAHFKEGSLKFSDRNTTNGEFRSGILKEALQSGNYGNLHELCLQGHLTEQDTLLRYAVPPHKHDLTELLTASNHSLSDPQIVQVLREQIIGNTTLAKLFGIS